MDTEKIYVVPKPGLRVVDPATGQALPPEGGHKPRDTYWMRRLNDGDVTEATPPAEAKPAKKAKE